MLQLNLWLLSDDMGRYIIIPLVNSYLAVELLIPPILWPHPVDVNCCQMKSRVET
jgi:hypothetical protein